MAIGCATRSPVSGPHEVVSQATPTVIQDTAGPTQAAPSPQAPIVTAQPLPTPSATPIPEPTSTPQPTPINVVNETTWSVGSSKTSESGKAGTYSWTDVAFDDDLARLAWVAKAPSGKGCSLQWSATGEYSDQIARTVKVGAGGSASSSKEFESGYGAFTLDVVSTCPSWTITLTSYEKPAYWNPWGYNFKAGSRIYDPPDEFCSYFDCIPSFWDSTAGYVMQCSDKMFSHSGGRSGSCSYHGGNYRPLYRH